MSWQCRCGAHNAKVSVACEACGFEPQRAVEPTKPSLPMYREFPEITRVREPMTEEIRAMLSRLKASFEVVAPAVRVKAVETFKRCPACAEGRFVHLGVRFCLECFGRL